MFFFVYCQQPDALQNNELAEPDTLEVSISL